MGVQLQVQLNVSFEWDDEKRERNLTKHGIDFVRAVKIFENPVVERLDDHEDYGEERIISAWKAGADEERTYDDRLA